MTLFKKLRAGVTAGADFVRRLVAMGKETSVREPMPLFKTPHDRASWMERYIGPGLWRSNLHPQVEAAFYRALRPRPTSTRWERVADTGGRRADAALRSRYFLADPDEYVQVNAKGTMRRREPKNEYKARKRAEFRALLQGRRLAAAAAA